MAEGATAAVILAAGRGERLGADKALVDLGGRTAVERLVQSFQAAGCAPILVVRQRGSAALPPGLPAEEVAVESAEMIESLRGGLRRLEADPPAGVLVTPIDHAMVRPGTIAALRIELDACDGAPAVVLPICRGRPGHPVGLTWDIAQQALDPEITSLRDVIRRDPARNLPVFVEDGWTRRDLDHPADLAAARGHLSQMIVPATELMARHRSRRAFRPDPVGDDQLAWLVDSARHASTSSFVQAVSVVAVRDPERKRRFASLCADQAHVHEAPVVLAICADLHRLAAACARHGTTLESDSLESFVQATVDAAILGQNLQLAAESEGLGSCMIGAARNHPVELAELLGLPDHVYVVFGMTLGWPADDPLPRTRLPLDAILHHETYDVASTESVLDRADASMRADSRAANARRGPDERPVNETRGWTDRMSFLFRGPNPPKGREHLMAALRARGFGLRDPELD
ncbi:MAG: NTP transferase domain-containing protein [Planctomycetota bacterium]